VPAQAGPDGCAAGEGLTILVNSIYNSARYEDVWLDK
jgi:hypothetical protein